LAQGFETYIEFGPGKVLAGLAKRISQPLEKNCTVQGMSDSAGLTALEALLK
jgi:malonyl CoA-acyl carrier protein transacylase